MKSKIDKLEFNTYCTFTEEKSEIEETIGLVFKDYIRKVASPPKFTSQIPLDLRPFK